MPFPTEKQHLLPLRHQLHSGNIWRANSKWTEANQVYLHHSTCQQGQNWGVKSRKIQEQDGDSQCHFPKEKASY